MSPEDLSDEIASDAQGPMMARGDSGSVQQFPLTQKIAADRYLAAKAALADSTKRTFGVRMGRLVPPGAI